MDRKNYTEYLCKIEFFNNDKSLGTFDLILGSTELHRRMIAIDHDIKEWTHYIVDNGRYFGARLNKNFFLAGYGEPLAFKLDVAESVL